jgi:ATP-dependent Clp protease ATP-binding subunit ClpX
MAEREAQQRDRGLIRDLRAASRQHQQEALEKIRQFSKTPKQVYEYLDRYIVGQESGKRLLSVYISCHFKEISDMLSANGSNIDEMLKRKMSYKENILMIGPPGCGKTRSIDILCRPDFLGIPSVTEDMTKFSESGYVGAKVEDIPYHMFIAANKNPYLASFGIYELDCIDKIRKAENLVGRDVSGEGVQNSLLRPIEGTTVILPPNLQSEVPTLSTNYNLFVASGVFDGLEDILKRRLDKEGRLERLERELGSNFDWRGELRSEDLIEFGMIPEFTRRFPVRVFYNQLTEDDLTKILRDTQDSPKNTYIERARKWGIELRFAEDAYREIAKYAVREQMGAGGLVTAMSNMFTNEFFEKFGEYRGSIEVTPQYVREKLRMVE